MTTDGFFKYTEGYVTQYFQKNAEGKFECVDQNFTAGHEVTYTDVAGSTINPPQDEVRQPFDMVGQKTPSVMPDPILYGEEDSKWF